MLLTCPQCRSGLQVPDDTTALVRCPACKTVFSPAGGAAPEPDEEEDEPKAKTRRPQRDEEEDERPRKKPRRSARTDGDEDEDEEPENRDFDPVTEEEDRARRRRKRPKDDSSGLSPEEKAAKRAAFQRAAWGARLIWISFGLFLLSMLVVIIFFFQFTFRVVTPGYLTIAGAIGLVNWVLAAVGVGLCLSGPRTPGHWGYGIGAAVAVFVHGVFLLVIVTPRTENASGRDVEGGSTTQVRWARLATNLDHTMFYLLALAYSGEQGIMVGKPPPLYMIAGIFEMVRTMFIMLMLSCLSRAALDEELAHKCTRAAGAASIAPALVAVIILIVFAFLIETNAGLDLFARIVINTTVMGVYAIMMGVVFPSFMTAREVADACDEPFQSLIPQL
ncbi:hypothetical protein [Frigoriglobus tundricola]|uniref:Uncharacterized protein n=1 Tax=Frigoriglobus tundricola TaxID=2774151 RepID=A0A6M5YM21_9BACT|nr:hypothetical protein [Frigoriglobus tundricola]QJW94353.1 hypothetical protein FTUN_1873 [Frigoriglobus tundricola]